MYELTRAETKLLRRLSTPDKVQRYLDGLVYNIERDGETVRSPRRVMRDRTAHCAEGAFLAAAAFRINGRPPLLVDLEADNDDDHVLAVYRDRGLWGSVATSKFSGLRFRAPVYPTIRELVMSYFEDYFNWDGDRTLRAYSRALSLKRFDRINWMTAEEDLWPVIDWLTVARHTALLPQRVANRLPRVDRRSFQAGVLGAPGH
ncbi:MAG: hypothetical protein M3O80_05085 [Chloroflexota bacterium]|nr:hypothetical protein [Chloroflexota bacterium]